MSKQLSIAAAFSVFAMAAFALSATSDRQHSDHVMATGTKAQASAPALGRILPAMFTIGD